MTCWHNPAGSGPTLHAPWGLLSVFLKCWVTLGWCLCLI
jgi:hypothetical protein